MANFKRIPVLVNAATGKQIDEFGAVVRDNDFFRLLFDETVVLCCQFYDISWIDGEAQLNEHSIDTDLTLEAFGDNDFDPLTSFMFLSQQTEDAENQVNIANDWLDGTTASPLNGQLSFRINTNTVRFNEALQNNTGSQKFYFCICGVPSGQTEKNVLAYFRFKAENRPSSSVGTPETSDPEYLTAQEVQALAKSAPIREFSIDGATLWHDTQVDADRYYREQRNGGEWSEAIALIVGAVGDSAYVYVAYASNDTGSDFSLTPGANLLYRAEIHTNQVLNPPVEADFAGADWGKMGHSVYSMAGFASDDSGSDFSMVPSDSLPYIAFVYITDMGEYLSSFDDATWVKYLGNNGTGVAPQGEYAAGTTYALNEGVTYDGSYYRSKVADNTGNQPDTSTTQWELMISSVTGDTGATGSTNVCFVTAPAFDSTLECLVFPLDDVNAVLKTDRVPSIASLKANVISANSSFTGNVVIYPTAGRTELTQAGWTASTGVSGAYYRAITPGTEPTFTTEDTSMLKKVANTASLVAGSWCWDDGDTLGYDTLYVYPNTGNTPTTDDDGFYQYDTVSSQTIAVGASEAEKTITISSTTPLSVELWRDTNDASDTLVDGSSVPVSVYFSTLEYNK